MKEALILNAWKKKQRLQWQGIGMSTCTKRLVKNIYRF